MNILQRLKGMYDRQVKAAEARAKARVAKATTQREKEMAKMQLERDKQKLRKEYFEAKIATQKATTAANKARKEAGDLTIGEKLGRFGKQTMKVYRALQGPPPRKRRVTKRKTITKNKTTARRRTR